MKTEKDINEEQSQNGQQPVVGRSYSRIECIDDALNCIALHIYGKEYKDTHLAERDNIHSKNECKDWLNDNREALLKHSRLK